MSNNIPNLDPANNYSLVGVFQTALKNFQQSLNGMLPAQVLSYDRASNRAEVQLMINLVTTGGQQIPRARLPSIPVLILGCGTFSLSFPLNAGDQGWVLANDRDISLFLQNLQENYTVDTEPPTNPSIPNTTRMNNFADAMFIPDTMKTFNPSSIADGYVSLQSNDSDASLSIQIGLNPTTSAYELNINCDRTTVNVNSNAGYFIIDGNLFVNGLIQSPTGSITQLLTPPPYPP